MSGMSWFRTNASRWRDGLAESLFNDRQGFKETALASLFFLIVGVIAIGANPWRGQTSTPLDLLASYPGWGAVVDKAHVRHRERSDALDARLPQWLYARAELRQGRLPLWNDTSAGGDASLLKLTSGQLTPSFALFAVAPTPAQGFYLSILFNLLVAGTGMFLFLRLHVSVLPASFGGVAFQLCGFNVAWLYWSHMLTVMWAPWLLLAVHLVVKNVSSGRLAGLACATAAVLLGGFPFVAQLVLGAAILYGTMYALGNALVHDDIRHWVRASIVRVSGALLGLALGFLLAAIPLLTFVQWLQQFDVAHRSGGSGLSLLEDWRLLFWPWAYSGPRVESSMYVGTAAALLAMLGFVLFWIYRDRDRASGLGAYALVLAVFSAVLTFELLPVEALAWIPGLGMNLWSRAISILNIAIAISAAVALQKIITVVRLSRPDLSAVTVCVICVISAVQLYDQLKYYRKFNGPTLAQHFYPRTSILDQVISKSGPFDYVIADTAYIISGSLGGYGIREWFAHRFKTRELKKLLPAIVEDPFATATASPVQTRSIRFDAPEMRMLNVRYLLLVDERIPRGEIARGVVKSSGLAPLPALPANSWHQTFQVRSTSVLNSIAVRLATYKAEDVDGSITIELKDEDGTVVSRAARPAGEIEDNKYLAFTFDSDVNLKPGAYTWRLAYAPGVKARPITVWSGKRAGEKGSLRINGNPSPRVVDYVAYGRVSDSQFRRIMREGRISLWENKLSPNGPYFVENVDRADSTPTSKVDVERYAPSQFSLRYTGRSAGYVVVPMELTDDWIVTIDGRAAEMLFVRGVLPAVKVHEPSVIHFRYAPRPLRFLGIWVTALLLTSMALLTPQWRAKYLRRTNAAVGERAQDSNRHSHRA